MLKYLFVGTRIFMVILDGRQINNELWLNFEDKFAVTAFDILILHVFGFLVHVLVNYIVGLLLHCYLYSYRFSPSLVNASLSTDR